MVYLRIRHAWASHMSDIVAVGRGIHAQVKVIQFVVEQDVWLMTAKQKYIMHELLVSYQFYLKANTTLFIPKHVLG